MRTCVVPETLCRDNPDESSSGGEDMRCDKLPLAVGLHNLRVSLVTTSRTHRTVRTSIILSLLRSMGPI